MKSRTKAKLAAIVASAGLVAGLGACAGGETNSAGSTGAAGDGTIKLVASTKVWADIADAVTDDKKVSIEPIIESNDIDPHSYQPTAADMAKVEGADILLAGGGHYDAWLTSSLKDKKDKTIISALAIDEHAHDHAHDHGAEGHDHAHEGETTEATDAHAGHDHEAEGHDHSSESKAPEATDAHDHEAEGHDHAHEGEAADAHAGHDHGNAETNEHIWYDTDKVDEVAHQLADALKAKGAEANTDAIHKELKEIKDSKSKIKAAKVAQIHPLADDIISDTKVEDITPEGYRKATLSESEPTAADVNEMLKLIESGKLDYIIDAPQTHDQVSERLLEAAKAKGVKVVNVYESPSKDESYFDLYKRTLSDMEKI
nr:zinc ABC transporter substrate-binding protein [Corynebacterium lactis]